MTEISAWEKKDDGRFIWICMGTVVAAILFIWPFVNLPYGDDTAYAYVALRLSQTGHLAYNGWQAALLIFHAYWGALFIRLFGFSFLCLKLSTLPFTSGSVGFCYLLVRRLGLPARGALFVTLLFGLCPIFLPVSVAYMTDAPGLFFTFASFYAFLRAAELDMPRQAYKWLALGVVLGFIGGTGRQSVWFVPLVVLPCLALARWKQKSFAITSLAAWILVLCGVAATTAWFNRQQYVVYQPSIFSEAKLLFSRPFWTLNVTARLLLMLLLMCLPAAVPLARRAWHETWRGTRPRKIIVGSLLLALGCAIFIHPSLASIPWVSSTLNWEGINGSAPLPGRPIVLIRPIRAIVALSVYVTICILAGELAGVRKLPRRALDALCQPSNEHFALVTMTLFSAVYFVLLLVRATEFDVFDRYLLPLLPWSATILLLWSGVEKNKEQFSLRAMPVAWILLVTMAAYGIVSTQDLWSLARARVAAVKKLETAGVPRTAIDGAFEINAWTQLMLTGRMNSRWVSNPPDAYNPAFGQTPSVVPVYRLEYAPTPETTPSEFDSIPYFSLLPPFRKQVSIDRIKSHQ